MEEIAKPGAGRPAKSPALLKRPRTMSFTDAEYQKLGELAQAARLGRSEYIVEKLGLMPALLDDFKSRFPEYNYYIDSNVISSDKVAAFKEFLSRFKSDCNFSMTSAEPKQYLRDVYCGAYSTSGNDTERILIVLASDREQNKQEYEALRKEWVDVLELSLDLEDKWNGTSYSAYKRLTLEGKKRILKQFFDKYKNTKLSVNDSYGGGTTFRIAATTKEGEVVLVIDYLPQRTGEASELKQALEEYQQAK
jgi:hypothetical protein